MEPMAPSIITEQDEREENTYDLWLNYGFNWHFDFLNGLINLDKILIDFRDEDNNRIKTIEVCNTIKKDLEKYKESCEDSILIKEGKEEKEDEVKIHSISFKDILLLAIATSIDALAVGVSFAFLKVNLWIATTTIGITTFVLSFICVLFGKTLGNLFEKYAEYMGGSILILLGIKILIEHLFF